MPKYTKVCHETPPIDRGGEGKREGVRVRQRGRGLEKKEIKTDETQQWTK